MYRMQAEEMLASLPVSLVSLELELKTPVQVTPLLHVARKEEFQLGPSQHRFQGQGSGQLQHPI